MLGFLRSANATEDQPAVSDAAVSSQQISSFVALLAREYFVDIPDRRSEPRYSITLPVVVQPVDDDLHPVGLQLRAVTRDISASGIGLICQDPLNSDIIVQLDSPSGQQLRARARVLRCQANGYYFDVGCQFVTAD